MATPSARAAGRASLAVLAVAITLAACSEQSTQSPEAERGRQIYRAQCIACHDPDPTVAGPVGPPLKGASRELLEAKVLKGTYPPGYTPKRSTAIMPPQPSLGADVPYLAAFLK
jgi:mono/diheme cytochrome c family protein